MLGLVLRKKLTVLGSRMLFTPLLFEPIFVVRAVENRVPYHWLATRNSVT